MLTTADRLPDREGTALDADPTQNEAILTRINVDDLIKAFKLERLRLLRGLMELMFWMPARRFAQRVLRYDALVGQGGGLHCGAEWISRQYAGALQFEGLEHLPPSGPLLLFSNHPGMTDAMGIFAALGRPDLRVVAAERMFLQVLPNISRHLIYISEEPRNRMAGVRAVATHLRRGGAVLTFPAGRIEPDPAIMPDARVRLREWSESVALFVRLAPQALVVPTVVSGVISPTALQNPLTRLYRTRKERDWAGATLQVLWTGYRTNIVRVRFGAPIPAAELVALGDASAIMRVVIEHVERLMPQQSVPIPGYRFD